MVTCDYIYIDKVSHLKSLASYFGLLDSQRNRLWAPASRLHPPLLQKLFRPIFAFCLASFVLVTVQVQRLLRPLVHIHFLFNSLKSSLVLNLSPINPHCCHSLCHVTTHIYMPRRTHLIIFTSIWLLVPSHHNHLHSTSFHSNSHFS